MIITEEELLDLDACEEGLETFCEANGESATILEALDSNGVEDVLWYLSETKRLTSSQEEDLVGFAKSEALVNIDLIKSHCFESDFEVILGFLLSRSVERAARSAARLAAQAAADFAAESAADFAAHSAAHSAGYLAARSAESAAQAAAQAAADSSAAYLVARSAARSAGYSAAQLIRQENKLREIFLKW